MASLNLSTAPKGALNECAEVTLEDQQMINRFARLDLKHDELDSKLTELKRKQTNINEAVDELMLNDDDFVDEGDQQPVYMRYGEFFVTTTNDESQKILEERKKALQEQLKTLEASIKVIKDEMSTIKATLYAKFGNSINLDHK